MHAWAALKPADIVQAAQALRDMIRGEGLAHEAQDTRPVEEAASNDVRAGGSAPAE